MGRVILYCRVSKNYKEWGVRERERHNYNETYSDTDTY